LRSFFGKAKLAVTFEGRKNTQEEEDAILDTIRQESSVNIVCVVEKEKEESFERPLARIEEMAQGDFAQFYRGSLSGKKILETEQSLIVLGDVSALSAEAVGICPVYQIRVKLLYLCHSSGSFRSSK